MLSLGIEVGLVFAGIADDLDDVQAVFYAAAIIFTGLSLTSGNLLYKKRTEASASEGPSRTFEQANIEDGIRILDVW